MLMDEVVMMEVFATQKLANTIIKGFAMHCMSMYGVVFAGGGFGALVVKKLPAYHLNC